MFGDYFCYILKQGGCALQIKVDRDQENIFHFELYVNNIIIMITLFGCANFFSFVFLYYIQWRLKGLSALRGLHCK